MSHQSFIRTLRPKQTYSVPLGFQLLEAISSENKDLTSCILDEIERIQNTKDEWGIYGFHKPSYQGDLDLQERRLETAEALFSTSWDALPYLPDPSELSFDASKKDQVDHGSGITFQDCHLYYGHQEGGGHDDNDDDQEGGNHILEFQGV